MKNHSSRRRFIKNSALFVGAGMSFPLLRTFAEETNAPAAPSASATNLLTLDASARPAAASTEGFHMGTATAPGGHTLTMDSRSLLRDGKPWMLISGEFHYARCPESGVARRTAQNQGRGSQRRGELYFLDSPRGGSGRLGLGRPTRFAEISSDLPRGRSRRAAAHRAVVSWRSPQRRFSRLAAKNGRRQSD